MQRPKIVKKSLEQQNKIEGLKLPDFKIYNKATVITTV